MNWISVSMHEVFIKQVNNSLVHFSHILGLFLCLTKPKQLGKKTSMEYFYPVWPKFMYVLVLPREKEVE